MGRHQEVGRCEQAAFRESLPSAPVLAGCCCPGSSGRRSRHPAAAPYRSRARWQGGRAETLPSVGLGCGYRSTCCSGATRRSGRELHPLWAVTGRSLLSSTPWVPSKLKQLRYVPWPPCRIPGCCLYSSVRPSSVSAGSGEEATLVLTWKIHDGSAAPR